MKVVIQRMSIAISPKIWQFVPVQSTFLNIDVAFTAGAPGERISHKPQGYGLRSIV